MFRPMILDALKSFHKYIKLGLRQINSTLHIRREIFFSI